MLVERFSENPLITPASVPASRDDFEVVGAFNAGAIKFNNEILLLLRVAERPKDKAPDEEVAPILNPATGQLEFLRIKHGDSDLQIPDSRAFYYKEKLYLTSISHLRIARSKDGIHFTIDSSPAVFPATEYETFGIEDPRITKIGDEFFITPKAASPHGICTILIKTKDFVTFQRQGVMFYPETSNVALFPEKINDKYYAFIRPGPKHLGEPAIWIASSNDLIHWGGYRVFMSPAAGKFDSVRIGASCVPIKTDKGWLEIYHGANEDNRYCLGAVLSDLNDPTKIIARSAEPIMQPTTDYEIGGFFGNVIFSCGAVVNDNDELIIYYGAGDASTAAAKTTIDKILKAIL